MVAQPQPVPVIAAPARERVAERVSTVRVALADGAATTVHVAAFCSADTRLRVVRLREPAPLVTWCAAQGLGDALVGGFFTRPGGAALGELRTSGLRRASVAFDAPWAAVRGCLHVSGGAVRVAPRGALACEPRGDLLQAGPLLVAGGRRMVDAGEDPEGFAAGASQFDSDITAGRYPRAALGLAPGRLLAVAADGRSPDDAGLTLVELADLLVALGADAALNLDGGGSTSLVCDGVLRNHPRADHDVDLPLGRPIVTALAFERRA